MCRSIKTLRPPMTPEVEPEDVRAAALQYVRKISGFRAPSARNRQAFDAAVDAVAEATQRLLDELEVRPSPAASSPASPAPVPAVARASARACASSARRG
jgi:hypothetical protein